MFSYDLINPNNFIINNDNFDVIPIGYRCATAIACNYAKIRNYSLPFDWGIPWTPKKIQTLLEENFKDFFNFELINKGVYNKTYKFGSMHFNNDINILEDTFKRRIDRLNDIMNKTSKKYFIYINEDFLYSENHRTDELCNTIFSELLEFENFLKQKYENIDYNILFIDFKKQDIPTNSNIIHVVLHSSKLYEKTVDAPFEDFRMYCGQILSELFHTNILKENIIKYNQNIFND